MNQVAIFVVVADIKTMALEIKSTPVLKGLAADRFTRIVEENQHKRITPKEKAEMTKLVEKALKKAKF